MEDTSKTREEGTSLAVRFKPVLDRRSLYGLAGVAWAVAGLILLSWTVRWLEPMSVLAIVALGVLGAVVAVLAGRYMFTRLVRRNIERIESGPERACAFSFLAWKSYGMMIGMIALGIVLRHSAAPRAVLAPAYEAMGGALLVASVLYFKRFLDEGRLLVGRE
jgi:hypothetical protein